MKNTLGAIIIASSLTGCAAQQDRSSMGFMGEDTRNPNITYWGAGTSMDTPDILAQMGVTCDRTQRVFDPDTGEAFTFIPPEIVTSAEENNDETIIICTDTGLSDL